jgi:pimeloyl-ACP methyl ester carboxylesterase
MPIPNKLANWLLGQLELMPIENLARNMLFDPERLFDRLLGEKEVAEVRAMLSRPQNSQTHVPTILMPGILGSLLASIRGISALLWLNPTVVLDGKINLLNLNEDGTGDESPDVEIAPVGIEKFTYLKLIIALAQETRLYEFPYDWRRRLEWNAAILHESIQRWSTNTPDGRFVLIGHSMGGLLARTYLALYPEEAERHVERIIMIGSPIYGAPLASLIYTSDTVPAEIVTRLNPANDVQRLAANMPSSYQLLPPPPELFPTHRPYPFNWDLYDASAWKLPYIRQDYLDQARQFHRLLAQSDPQVEIHQIAGCHQPTVTDIRRFPCEDEDFVRPTYALVRQENGEDSGDNTVPLWSTQCQGISTYYVEEGHLMLPANRQVIEAVLRLTRGESPELPRKIPQASGLLNRLAARSLVQQVADLRERIENGELGIEDIHKLFFTR